LRDLPDLLANQSKDRQANKALQASQASLAPRVLKVKQVLKVLKARKASLVPLENRGLRVRILKSLRLLRTVL
jgi:hypothetical protein